MVKFKERSYLSKLGYSLKDNPCKFWSYYKAITKTTKIPGVMKNESVQATRPIDQANLFNVFFTHFLPYLTLEALLPVYPDSTITLNVNYRNYALALATFLNNFNRLMSTRPLLVLPLSYCKKACANEISPLLCRFVNFSLELGTFPEKWKDANLVPIHKCESKTMVSNYRGISLLHVLF